MPSSVYTKQKEKGFVKFFQLFIYVNCYASCLHGMFSSGFCLYFVWFHSFVPVVLVLSFILYSSSFIFGNEKCVAHHFLTKWWWSNLWLCHWSYDQASYHFSWGDIVAFETLNLPSITVGFQSIVLCGVWTWFYVHFLPYFLLVTAFQNWVIFCVMYVVLLSIIK